MGIESEYFPISFDDRLLARHQSDGPRPHALTFVGGLGGHHSQGTKMLNEIARIYRWRSGDMAVSNYQLNQFSDNVGEVKHGQVTCIN